MSTPFEYLQSVNRLVHEPARLAILVALSACDKADFFFLLNITGLTKGNLSSHLSKLEQAQLVEIEKTFEGKIPITYAKLTLEGKEALIVSRAFGAIRERIPGGGTGVSNITGVQVEVGEKQAAIDLDIVVEYGASIVDLARAVRRNVITAVERMTGLEVIEVNIAVNDIHLPEAEDGTEAQVVPAPTRVE